ncbi:MAG: alpha/beta hydrolase [Planctomycetota bacterium]
MPAGSEIDTQREEEYAVVKVFYGTDRNAVEVLASDGPGFTGWYALTVSCAAITVILTLVAFRFARRSMMLVLAGAGVAVTVGLGVVTTLARLQGEPPGPRLNRTYGNQRGEMEMGTCEVSIPRGHEVGEVERPSVFRFEFREDPRRHVVLLDVEKQEADAFFADLQARVEASQKKEAFVFVHGYNVTFNEAAQRTAQLAHDLKFDGAPIFFSWPSQGEVLQYAVDETNVVWAVPHLKEFLAGIAKRSNAEAVHVIAHSMGNRALTSALELLSRERRSELPLFREVVLAAPDIDAEVFRRDIVPAIVPTADRVTLYASSNDEALKLSKTIHGYRRAGDSGSQLLVVPGVDTIDVSTVDTSLLGHYYYGSNRSVIADMLDLINEAKPPELRRWLEPRPFGHLMYWVFHGDPTTLGASPPPGAPVRR